MYLFNITDEMKEFEFCIFAYYTCKYNRIVLFPSLYMDLVIHVDLSKTPNSTQSD